MAQYTTNVVSKFGPEQKQAGWPWRLLIFSILLLGLAALSYGGLAFGYIPYIGSQIADINDKLTRLEREVDPDTQNRFLDFYSQILGVQQLLDSHLKQSQFLKLLENATNKKVRYARMKINAALSQVELEGSADSYEHLAQQLESFRQTPGILKFVLKESHVDEKGDVTFSAVLNFAPNVIK